MTTNPPVSLPQAQALKALGFQQDVWPQLVYLYGHDWDLALWSADYTHVWHDSRWFPAPDTVTAILWVLGTEAAGAAGLGEQGLYVEPDGYCYLRTVAGPYGMESDTLPDLLTEILVQVT